MPLKRRTDGNDGGSPALLQVLKFCKLLPKT